LLPIRRIPLNHSRNLTLRRCFIPVAPFSPNAEIAFAGGSSKAIRSSSEAIRSDPQRSAVKKNHEPNFGALANWSILHSAFGIVCGPKCNSALCIRKFSIISGCSCSIFWFITDFRGGLREHWEFHLGPVSWMQVLTIGHQPLHSASQAVACSEKMLQRVFSLKSLFCNVMKKSKEAVKYPQSFPGNP
jgi:hypothetical protein